MPKNCEKFKELIVSLTYDELSETESGLVQSHLSDCEGCSKFKAEIEQTGNLLENWVDVDIPVDLASLHSRAERKPIRARFSFFRLPLLLFRRNSPPPFVKGIPLFQRGAGGIQGDFFLATKTNSAFRWAAIAFGIMAVLFVAFGLIGTEIKWEGNSLTVRFGGESESQDERPSEMLLPAQYQALRAELSEELQTAFAQLSQAILENQENQKVQWNMLIEALQAQRNYDMELIKEELQNLANATEDELQKAYLTLDLLIANQASTQISEDEQSKSKL